MEGALSNPWHDDAGERRFAECDTQWLAAYESRLQGLAKGDPGLFRFHLNLFPEPFIGDPGAPVVLLSLNPGYKPGDERAHTCEPFRTLAQRNIEHKFDKYPFFALDPRIHDTPLARWWSTTLRDVLARSSPLAVARNVFAAELYPYHSVNFRRTSPPPSLAYTTSLVQAAMDRGALVVVMRGHKEWTTALKDIRTYGRVYHVCGGGRRLTINRTDHIGCYFDDGGFDELLRCVNEG